MTKEQYNTLKEKLPSLLLIYIDDGQVGKLCRSMNIDHYRLIHFLFGEKFPTKKELKSFCEEFKLSYSTLKTWDVIHIDEDELS